MCSTEIMVQEDERSMQIRNAFVNSESFKDIYNIGKMFASSTLVPQNFQGKPMDCTIAVDIANRMGVSPMMVMQNLHVVQGKPQWSGQACMSLIRGSREFKGARPIYIGERNTDEWGCYIRAVDAETGDEVRGSRVTITMAKAEGWYGKNGSKWKTMPEQMLAYRAAAFFARVYIPNALMGIAVEGEIEDMTPSELSKPVMPILEGEAEERFT